MADEPLLESAASGQPSLGEGTEDDTLRNLVARLVREQPYAVLCTQGEGQPYGSLVALAVTDDLSLAVFATPITTRKYRLLCDCDHVALVIDSRSRSSADMMHIEAVTATGRARQVPPGAELEQEAKLLVARHPQLELFVRSPTTALFHVDIARELGIPCVNGVAHVVDLLQDGDRVTVDGYLGIVTVGTPEFSLELERQPSRIGSFR